MEIDTALKNSQQLIQGLFEVMPGFVLVVAADGSIVQANAEAIRLLGLTFDSATMRYTSHFAGELFHEDGSPWPIQDCPVTRCLMTGQPQTSQTIGTRLADGNIAWGICSAVPMLDQSSGQLTGAVSITIDITRRKLAEEELRRSHELQRKVTESADDLIFLKDLSGVYRFVNPAAARFSGLTPEQMVGKDDFALFPAELAREFRDRDRQVLESGEQVTFEDVLERDGQSQTFITSKSLCRDDQDRPIAIVGIAHDITERKLAEDQLARTCEDLRIGRAESELALQNASQALAREASEHRRSKEERHRMASVLEATSDFVGMATPDGQCLYVNAAGRKMLGRAPKEDLTGRHVRETHPDWAADKVLLQGLPAAIRDGSWSGETALLHRDGSEIPVSQVIVAHKDSAGKVEYFSTLARDISDSKRQEATIARHLFELRILNRVGTICAESATVDEVLQRVTGLISESLYPDNCGFLLLNAAGNALSPHDSFVLSDSSVRKQDIPLQAGVTGLVARTGQPRRVDDVTQEPSYLACDLRTRSELCVPLKLGATVAGVVNVEMQTVGAFSVEDERLLVAVADAVGAAIERLRAQAALAESQRRLARILEGANIGMWDWDLATNRTAFSKEWKSQLGYAPHEVADDYKEWETRVHPEDLAPALAKVKAAREERPDRYDVEFRMRHKDGTWRWILSHGFVLLGPDGQPARMMGVHLDMTERKTQEESLAQGKARLAALLESSQDAIWSIDEEQRLVVYNTTFSRLFEQIFGNAPTLGGTPRELLPPPQAEHWIRHHRRALQGEAFSVTEQYPVLGDPRDFQIQLNPAYVAGRVTGVTLVSRDVTELKRALTSLQEEQSINRSTLENISDGVIMCDERGKFKVYNPAAERILGKPGVADDPNQWSETYGLFCPDGTPFPTVDLPLVRALRGEFVDNAELLMRRDDLPEDVWLSVNTRPLVDAAGQRRGGAVAAFRDVTAQKKIQAAIEADREFKRVMLEAHDRDRKFTSLELHDGLVQDVSAAKMYVEALRTQYAATALPNRDAFKTILQTLRRAVEEGRRIMSGLCPPVMEEFGVVAGIEYLVNELQQAGTTKVTFAHDVNFHRLDLLLEGTLFRIAQEALNNVRRHSQAATAHIVLSQLPDLVRLEIRDTGVGFDISNVPHDRYGVYGMAERTRLFNGRCSIQSTPGKGTHILIELPIDPGIPLSPAPLTPSPV
ncbi:MAG: PAS domain S-box protein [Pirellulales bacterium]